MHHIDVLSTQQVHDMGSGTRMHGQITGQTHGDPIDGQIVDEASTTARLGRFRGGGDDAGSIPPRLLGQRQRAHLSLDTPGAREVAVRDVGDPHALTVRHPGRMVP